MADMSRYRYGWTVAGAAVLALALGPSPALADPAGTVFGANGSDWTQYQNNLAGSGDNHGEHAINPHTIANLHADWVVTGGGSISAQPLAVGDTVYWGSWDGILHATSISTHATIWTTALGFSTCARCNPKVAGLASTPGYGRIGRTPVLWVAGGGNDPVGAGQVAVYAVDARTGAVIWRTDLAPVDGDTFLWSSIRVFRGSVYISTASQADKPVIPGQIFKLDAARGTVQASLSTGAGIWGTPTIDEDTGDMYVPMGGPSGGGTNDFSFSLLEVRVCDLSVVAVWTVPKEQQLSDGDFGSVPTLFTARVGGKPHRMVGLGNKNGIFYAWDRADIAAGPLWQDPVATGANGPQGGGGTISPPVWDGSSLYVAGGRTTVNGVACGSSVRALDPATGAYRWEFCVPTAHILGALTSASGLVVVPAGPSILVLSARTGTQVAAYTNPSGALFWGPPSIARHHIFAPSMDGSLAALTT
jgi:outer membrane protein assembly factor BamB